MSGEQTYYTCIYEVKDGRGIRNEVLYNETEIGSLSIENSLLHELSERFFGNDSCGYVEEFRILAIAMQDNFLDYSF